MHILYMLVERSVSVRPMHTLWYCFPLSDIVLIILVCGLMVLTFFMAVVLDELFV